MDKLYLLKILKNIEECIESRAHNDPFGGEFRKEYRLIQDAIDMLDWKQKFTVWQHNDLKIVLVSGLYGNPTYNSYRNGYWVGETIDFEAALHVLKTFIVTT